MAKDSKRKGRIDVSPTKLRPRKRENDNTRPISRDKGKNEGVAVIKESSKGKGKSEKRKGDSTRPIVRDDEVKPTEREKTTELEIGDVEVVSDEAEVKGEPTQKNKTSPPPHPKPQPKLPDPFEPPAVDPFEPPAVDPFEPPNTLSPPESWTEDEIDTSDWSTNPVKRILKKFKKGS